MIVNLTGDTVMLQCVTSLQELKPVFPVPSVETGEDLFEIDDFPTVYVTPGRIRDLPEPQPDTHYLVSWSVAQAAAAQGRTDCVALDPGSRVAGRYYTLLRAFYDPASVVVGLREEPPLRDYQANSLNALKSAGDSFTEGGER